MKAVICTKYGPPDVLEFKEIEKPVPTDNEVLIKVNATTVTAGDCEIRRFKIPILFWLPLRLYLGVIKPRVNILGQELAGEVEAVGKNVNNFKKGDRIFGLTGLRFGAYAQYVCLPDSFAIALKPENMTDEEAACVAVGGANALHFLKKAAIQPGQKVLIYGTSGSIGTFAVQLAKHYGAEVTGVCSTDKVELVKELGADKIIDYKKENFTRNGESYDVIFDTVGKSPFFGSLKSLAENGLYILTNPSLWDMIRGLWVSLASRKKVIFQFASESVDALKYLKELIEAGKITSVIDRCYPLEKMAEAHRYVEEGHKKGNVIVAVK